MSLLKGIGKQLQVGISKETTRGVTPATVTYWMAVNDWNIDEKFTNATDVQAYGLIEDSVSQTRVKNWAEGQIKAPLAGTTSALLFLSMFGTDTATAHSGETTVYDHTLTVAQTVEHQSVSFYVHDPIPTPTGATADYSHALGVVTKLSIDYSLGKFVDATYSIKAQKGSAAAVVFAPSQLIEDRFVPQYLSFKSAANVAGLSGATAIKIKSAKIDIDGSSEDDDVMGSLSPRDFLNKEWKLEGTIEAIWENESDFKTNALANVAQAFQLDLINNDVSYGVVPTHPEFKLIMSKVFFTEFSRPVKIKDVMYQTVKFKAAYSLSDGYMAKAVFTNTVASY